MQAIFGTVAKAMYISGYPISHLSKLGILRRELKNKIELWPEKARKRISFMYYYLKI